MEGGGCSVLRFLLVGIGVLLVFLGVCALCVCSYFLYETLQAPEDIRVVRYVMDVANIREPIFKGAFSVMTPSGPQNSVFQVEMSPPIKGIVFLLIGVLLLTALARIVSTVIYSGVGLLKISFPKCCKDSIDDA